MADATTDDAAYQAQILNGVSRTFALTIPQLPDPLRSVVTNAYLLCRVADTVEDDVALTPAEKQAYHRRLADVLHFREDAADLSRELAPRLSDKTLADERDLVAHLDAVTRMLASFPQEQRDVVVQGVELMCERMPTYQHEGKVGGLPTLADMDRYCFCVAGVVGKMLTHLFCHHASDIAAQRDDMLRLAPSFGQGLQMTNILKDLWDDLGQGSCWLPQEVFGAWQVDLAGLSVDRRPAGFAEGLRQLVAIAHGHLRNGLAYTLRIPSQHIGIRRFCGWSLGLAVLTLDRIHRNPAYRSGAEVKVSRPMLRTTIALTNATIRSDTVLSLLFRLAARRLPLETIQEAYFTDMGRLCMHF